jgi:hypothetical protein
MALLWSVTRITMDSSGARVNADLVAFQQFFEDWNRERGTNFFIGKDLKGLLNQAGFVQLQVSASCRVYADGEELEPMGSTWRTSLGIADAIRFANQAGIQSDSLSRWGSALQEWKSDPGALVVQMRCEVIGRKPAKYVEDESPQTRT